MRLRLENRSGYDTDDLARFFLRGLRATGTRVEGLRIVVVAAPQRSRGCAAVGGRDMIIAIAAPWQCRRTDCVRRLSRMFVHECAHIRGIDHKQMPRELLYSLGPTPDWAKGTKIRYRGRAPDQLPFLRKERVVEI